MSTGESPSRTIPSRTRESWTADASPTATHMSTAAKVTELRSEAAKVLGGKLAQVFLEFLSSHIRVGLLFEH